MSNLTSRHALVQWETYPREPHRTLPSPMRSDANPIDVEPDPFSTGEQGLVWFAVLVACVLAFHLVALATGGDW